MSLVFAENSHLKIDKLEGVMSCVICCVGWIQQPFQHYFWKIMAVN